MREERLERVYPLVFVILGLCVKLELLTATLDAKEAYSVADFVVGVVLANVCSTNRRFVEIVENMIDTLKEYDGKGKYLDGVNIMISRM